MCQRHCSRARKEHSVLPHKPSRLWSTSKIAHKNYPSAADFVLPGRSTPESTLGWLGGEIPVHTWYRLGCSLRLPGLPRCRFHSKAYPSINQLSVCGLRSGTRVMIQSLPAHICSRGLLCVCRTCGFYGGNNNWFLWQAVKTFTTFL